MLLEIFFVFDFRTQLAVDVTTGSNTKMDQLMGITKTDARIHLIGWKDIVNISFGDASTVSVCATKKPQFPNVM